MPTDLTKLDTETLLAVSGKLRARYDDLRARGLRLDMTRGKPSSAQLDLASPLLSLPGPDDYKAADGTDCRNYGNPQGLPEARALLSGPFQIPAAQMVFGNNSSLALMHDCIVYAMLHGTCDSRSPWSKEAAASGPVAFICPVPGYDRHYHLCEEYGIELITVPMTDRGPDMDTVERLVASDPRIKGMWCVPKYSNPTGAIYDEETARRLASMRTAAPDFRLFWDNAYAVHHLTDERVEIPDMLALCERAGQPNRPFVFGSTSKITLAGSGLALFGGSPENVKWLLARMSRRTIGPDKLNQLRHVRFLRDEAGLHAHMERHRAIIGPKFDAVQEIFERELGGSGVARWTTPKGGYFVSLDVMDGCARRVIELAKEAGIAVTPAGATFPGGRDPHDRNIRIAPTFPDVAEVRQAVEGIALCALVAAVDRLLGSRHANA
ncbi:MAG TPA: aminotransferase class I/II-fold pyridoxal phosphate-dependent enzyme [Stellaceae bacterium]